MENSLILYIYPHQFEPLITIVRSWVSLCQVLNYTEEVSAYDWNAVGELPVLQYRDLIIPKENILRFLKQVLSLNYELSEEEKRLSEMVEELCLSKLYPSTLYSLWMDDFTPKDFWFSSKSWLARRLPFQKLKFWVEKNYIKEYLTRQSNITSPQQAFAKADEAHSLLSNLLADKKLFFGNQNYPTSADVVVFAYLHYENAYLYDHTLVQNSMFKYDNLKDFLGRMDQSAVKTSEVSKAYYLQPPASKGCLPPKINIQVTEEAYKFRYVNPKKKALQLSHEETTLENRLYVSSVAGILLLYLLFKGK